MFTDALKAYGPFPDPRHLLYEIFKIDVYFTIAGLEKPFSLPVWWY